MCQQNIFDSSFMLNKITQYVCKEKIVLTYKFMLRLYLIQRETLTHSYIQDCTF
jgi:hypothetical protein